MVKLTKDQERADTIISLIEAIVADLEGEAKEVIDRAEVKARHFLDINSMLYSYARKNKVSMNEIADHLQTMLKIFRTVTEEIENGQ